MTPADLTLRTDSAEQTRAVAAASAPLFRHGDVVALTGELGAGKTCFVQGAARALGVEGRVTSPTFMLVRTYPAATVPIVHCDIYRLDRLQEVLDLGEDVMGPEYLTFIEWGDAAAPILPADRLDLEFVLDDADTGGDEEPRRLVRVRGHGDWALRVPDLRAAWKPWAAAAQEA